MNTHLDHKHELLLESLLAGSLPRNVHWSDVVELIKKLGEIEPHGGTEFAFKVGSQRAFFKRPSTHSLDETEMSRLRKFLREADLRLGPGKPVQPMRIIVVLDHHLARVYEDVDGDRVQREDAARPYDPHGFHRHLIHRKETHYQGQRVPEEPSFYEDLTKDLLPSQEIVLLGHGTGKSSALEFLAEYLKKHHPTIYQRVIATEVVDLSALTEPEIEAVASKHMSRTGHGASSHSSAGGSMSTFEPTWEPFEETAEHTTRGSLPETVFAFPKQHKEPMTDAQHVRNAVSRFDRVLDVSDNDRALAFANIQKAAKHYGVNLSETNWHELGKHPNPHRFEAAAKSARTRKRHSKETVGRKS